MSFLWNTCKTIKQVAVTTRLKFLLLLPFLLLGGVLFSPNVIFSQEAVTESGQMRPNIIFIYTDDHAYQSIGAYGSPVAKTPHLDRLAAEGMRFTNCVVTNSICGPMRAVVQTGKYSHKNGFLVNEGAAPFDTSQQTFPKLLRQNGYQTALVGKWHLLSDATPGFDYSEILIDQGPYFNPPMIRNGKRVKHEGYTTEIITSLSLDWLKKGRDPSKPFLLMCQHKATHREWSPTSKYYNRFKDVVFPIPETFDDDYSGRGRAALEQDMTIAETMTPFDLKLTGPLNNLTEEQKKDWHAMYDSRVAEYEKLIAGNPTREELTRWKFQCYMKDYHSCAASVDDSVGEILQYLKESGLEKNTLVVYSSDQGFYLGEHGWFDKRFMFEESFKTALLVRWPGTIKPNSVNTDIVSPLDFAETFLDLAGISIPAEMQGRSLQPLFEGKTPSDWRKSFYYHYYEYPASHLVKKHEGIYDGRFKLIHFYDDIDQWELYDLKTDPQEMRSIYDAPASQETVKRLEAELESQKKILEVPPLKPVNASFTDKGIDPNTRPGVREMQQRVINVLPERKARQKTAAP